MRKYTEFPKRKPTTHNCKHCNEGLTVKQGAFCDDYCHRKWLKAEKERKAAEGGGTGTYVKINSKTWVLAKTPAVVQKVEDKWKELLGEGFTTDRHPRERTQEMHRKHAQI